MGLPYSGPISMGSINTELQRAANTPNTSLAGGVTPTSNSQFGLASSVVNKVAPHRISEFYGYTHQSVVNGFTNIGYPTTSASGTITIYTAPKTFTLTVFGGASTGGTTGSLYSSGAGTVSRSASAYQTVTGFLTFYSTGTFTYTLTASYTGNTAGNYVRFD